MQNNIDYKRLLIAIALFIGMIVGAVIIVLAINKQNTKKEFRDVASQKTSVSKNNGKSTSYKNLKDYPTKEEVSATLETSTKIDNDDKTKLVDYLKSGVELLSKTEFPSQIKREQMPYLNLTTNEQLYQIYADARRGYKIDNLDMYKSKNDNVYQFVLSLKISDEAKAEYERFNDKMATQEEFVYYTGNYSKNIEQIELVQMHGEGKNSPFGIGHD